MQLFAVEDCDRKTIIFSRRIFIDARTRRTRIIIIIIKLYRRRSYVWRQQPATDNYIIQSSTRFFHNDSLVRRRWENNVARSVAKCCCTKKISIVRAFFIYLFIFYSIYNVGICLFERFDFRSTTRPSQRLFDGEDDRFYIEKFLTTLWIYFYHQNSNFSWKSTLEIQNKSWLSYLSRIFLLHAIRFPIIYKLKATNYLFDRPKVVELCTNNFSISQSFKP